MEIYALNYFDLHVQRRLQVIWSKTVRLDKGKTTVCSDLKKKERIILV